MTLPSLRASVPFHTRHLIVLSGTRSWPSQIVEASPTVRSLVKHTTSNLKLSLCSAPSSVPGTIDAYLFPDRILFRRLEIRHFNALDSFLKTIPPCSIPDDCTPTKSAEKLYNIGLDAHWQNVFRQTQWFVCTHGERDSRCGTLGAQTLRWLREALGLEVDGDEAPEMRKGSVGAWGISHLGGHVHAANVLYEEELRLMVRSYPSGHWFGGIQSKDDVASIVEKLKLGIIDVERCRGRYE